GAFFEGRRDGAEGHAEANACGRRGGPVSLEVKGCTHARRIHETRAACQERSAKYSRELRALRATPLASVAKLTHLRWERATPVALMVFRTAGVPPAHDHEAREILRLRSGQACAACPEFVEGSA